MTADAATPTPANKGSASAAGAEVITMGNDDLLQPARGGSEEGGEVKSRIAQIHVGMIKVMSTFGIELLHDVHVTSLVRRPASSAPSLDLAAEHSPASESVVGSPAPVASREESRPS